MEMVEHITPGAERAAARGRGRFSRGEVVPAINLRLRFGFARAPYTLRSRLIVVQVGQRRVGLIVDAAREFRNITAEAIRPPARIDHRLERAVLAGIANIGDRVVLLLNIHEVIKSGVDVPRGGVGFG